jgi:hypothetical protein
MTDVFISYKREERTECQRIADKLKALGLNVWFDARLTAGDSFTTEIEREVRRAKAVLVLWSPGSVQSRWVRNEADIGRERGVLCAAQLKSCDLPIEFRDIHFETLHDPQFTDSHPGWIKLLERIGVLTGRTGLASYSRALAEAGRPLEQWAAQHPDDPLAAKAAGIVAALAGKEPPPVPVARSGMGAAAIAMIALAAAVISGATAWTLMPTTPPSAVDPRLAALDMLGKWQEADLGDCGDAALQIALEGNGLWLSLAGGRTGGAVQSVENGWVQLGNGQSLKRDGQSLQVRSAAGASTATEYAKCPV